MPSCVLFVCVDALYAGQQIFSHGMFPTCRTRPYRIPTEATIGEFIWVLFFTDIPRKHPSFDDLA